MRDTEAKSEADNNKTIISEILKALTVGLRKADELTKINDTFGPDQVAEKRCIPVQYNLKCANQTNCTVQPTCTIKGNPSNDTDVEKQRTLFLWLKFQKSRVHFDKFLLLVDFYRFPLFVFDSVDICDITEPPILLLEDVELPCEADESLIQKALELLTALVS